MKTRCLSIKNSFKVSVVDRVCLHLDILDELADYSKEMLGMYENLEDWSKLGFLVYKKYYLERKKVLNLLKSQDFSQLFWIKCCQI